MAEVMPWTDGKVLCRLGQGGERVKPVAMEYAAEASYAPLVPCATAWKYTAARWIPEQLFDLETDPHELINLAAMPPYAGTLPQLRAQSEARWDLAALTPPCAKAKPAAGSSTKRCATGTITLGIISRCKKHPSATCAITWTLTQSKTSPVFHAVNKHPLTV